MLNENTIYENKKKYIQLLTKLNIDLTPLFQYLESVDYFEKPASTQYFRAYDGGLCQYALDLCFELGQLTNAYCPGRYTEEDIIKVALFKDLYRAELYEKFFKNVKNDQTGLWEMQPAYRYRENRPVFGDISFGSYMLAKRYISFTDEQIEAITQASTRSDYAGDMHEIMRSFPLVTLTKMADLATTYLA